MAEKPDIKTIKFFPHGLIGVVILIGVFLLLRRSPTEQTSLESTAQPTISAESSPSTALAVDALSLDKVKIDNLSAKPSDQYVTFSGTLHNYHIKPVSNVKVRIDLWANKELTQLLETQYIEIKYGQANGPTNFGERINWSPPEENWWYEWTVESASFER